MSSALQGAFSFATVWYDRAVTHSLSDEISINVWLNKIEWLAITSEDTRTIASIKSIAAKGAMVPLLCLAVTETTERVALGILSYAFSWMTFFIPPLSDRSYTFARDSLHGLVGSAGAISLSISLFFCGTPRASKGRASKRDGIICDPLSNRAINLLRDGPLKGNQGALDDKITVTILKNVAYKIANVGIIVFAPLEWVARTGLALVAYSFSYIATPIEWMIKTPLSVSQDKETHRRTPISCKAYKLSWDLFFYNYGVTRAWGAAVYNVVLKRNPTKPSILE